MENKIIVIVEDDWDIREMIRVVLDNDEYKLLLFSNLYKCKQMTPAITPDLFIIDVNLPDGDGIDYCSELRQTVTSKKTPVLIMSAKNRTEEARNAGADLFFEKPFDIQYFTSSEVIHPD